MAWVLLKNRVDTQKEEVIPMKIRHALVYGAGMMGKNIALVLSARPEITVAVHDIRPVDVQAAVRENLKPFLEAGQITAEELENRVARVTFVEELTEELGQQIDIVIECVFEDMDLKRQIFKKLEEVCREDTLLCTNTSVMSPSEISRDMVRRGRFVGTHFWNPAHLVPLVEVVKSDATTDEAAAAVLEFLTACGKKAVLCQKDVPGFIANRMQHALWREAVSIVEQGIADAATVDIAVKNSFGLRLPQLGPLENADMAGVDLTWNIHNYVLEYLEDSHRPSPLLTRLKEAGNLGFKTGSGFYTWTEEEKKRVAAELNAYLFAAKLRREKAAAD